MILIEIALDTMTLDTVTLDTVTLDTVTLDTVIMTLDIKWHFSKMMFAQNDSQQSDA